MTKENPTASVRNFLKEKVFIFLNENAKLITQFLFTALFMAFAAWFIFRQKHELNSVIIIISDANRYWILAGLGLVVFYIFIQGVMYVTSFASIGTRLKLWDAIILFLKRNFISVFLPAGAVSSLAFFSNEIEKKGDYQDTGLFCLFHIRFRGNSFCGYSRCTRLPVCCIRR